MHTKKTKPSMPYPFAITAHLHMHAMSMRGPSTSCAERRCQDLALHACTLYMLNEVQPKWLHARNRGSRCLVVMCLVLVTEVCNCVSSFSYGRLLHVLQIVM